MRHFTQENAYPSIIRDIHEELEETYQTTIPLFAEGQGMHNGTLHMIVTLMGVREAGVFSELEEHPKFREAFTSRQNDDLDK